MAVQAPARRVVLEQAPVATYQGPPPSIATIHIALLLAVAALVPISPAVLPAPSSLARVEAMVPEEPAAGSTLAAQVVLVVVVPVVARLDSERLGKDRTVVHHNKACPPMDAAVAEEAAARQKVVTMRPVAVTLQGCPLVEVTAETAHRLRLLGLLLHEQAAVVEAAMARAAPVEQVAVAML